MPKSKKDWIAKAIVKKTGKSGNVYRFVQLGNHYGVFHKGKPVNMRDAMRDCGVTDMEDQNSYQPMKRILAGRAL